MDTDREVVERNAGFPDASGKTGVLRLTEPRSGKEKSVFIRVHPWLNKFYG
jgi:hypothetical protein